MANFKGVADIIRDYQECMVPWDDNEPVDLEYCRGCGAGGAGSHYLFPYPRRHPEFSALSKNLAIILLNNGATTCDMKTSSVFARIKFLWLCEPVFWLRRRRARRALLAWAKLYVYFGREQKYSYLLARKRHENSGWRLG